jgi:hypothetical protein
MNTFGTHQAPAPTNVMHVGTTNSKSCSVWNANTTLREDNNVR